MKTEKVRALWSHKNWFRCEDGYAYWPNPFDPRISRTFKMFKYDQSIQTKLRDWRKE